MNTRVVDTSATCLKLGTLAFAIALTLRGGIASAQDDTAPEGVEEIVVTADPLRIIPNEDSGSSFGFNKSLLDTPRSVSFVSEEQISLLGISAADDLARIVPGTYTNRRWGLQGGIDVRNTPADMYFRGMKRLNMQGHARTSLAGMDAIEVVKGPPSPIYGMGRIGGYTNLQPKLGRSIDSTGVRLPEAQGFAQQIFGSWDRTETSFGVGGPLSIEQEGKAPVHRLWAARELRYVRRARVRRAEARASGREHRQHDRRLPARGRHSVAKLEHGRRVHDSRHAGPRRQRPVHSRRAAREPRRQQRRPDRLPRDPSRLAGDGRPVSGNEPLGQDFRWPIDPATGQPYEIGSFPVVPGIPQTLYDYLVAQCGGVTGTSGACPDPTGLLRAQGVGGPVPISGRLPVGFALDPRTVGVSPGSTISAQPTSRSKTADLGRFIFDLVNDVDENFTFKNQFFYDSLDSFKNSQLPYGENQDQWVMEDKFTITRRIPGEDLPRVAQASTCSAR